MIANVKNLKKGLECQFKVMTLRDYMQYLGGKSRISKQISGVINEVSRRKVKNSETDSEHMFKRERERERVTLS